VSPEAPPPPVQEVAQPTTRPFDAIVFDVGVFALDYLGHLYDGDQLQPGLPPVEELKDLVVELGVSTDASGNKVYGAVVEGGEKVSMRVRELSSDTPRKFRWDAIEAVSKRVVLYLTTERYGLTTVAVGPTSEQILIDYQSGRIADQRGGLKDPTRLDLFVVVGVVERVGTRSLKEAAGSEEKRSSVERRLVARSPIKPKSEDPANSIIRKDELDEYIYRSNRHPGRRVDVALSQGTRDGSVELDYLLTQNNPLTLFFQTSNTGSADSSGFRERFGLTHTQLTGADDILNIDYSTSSFDGRSQSVSASYQRPLFGSERLNWRAFGSYTDFVSSDIGLAGAGFDGNTLEFGGELVWNFYQRGELFLDLAGGLRYTDIEVTNQQRDGEVGQWSPYASLRAERVRDTDLLDASVTVSYAHLDGSRLDRDTIGRLDSDEDYVTVQASASYTFFLEPVLFPTRFREGNSTLAHELVLSGRATSSLGNRVIAQEQPTLGGLYSIRGYESSIAAGDNMVMGTVEYRWHIPRSLSVRPQPGKMYWPTWDIRRPLGPKPFRVAPQEPYGRPDWDLVFKSFVDAGRVEFNDPQPGVEFDQTLVSAGIGLDLQMYQNFVLSGIWGVALQDVDEGSRTRASAGSSQFWIVLTLLVN
jgi:hemolysin activation/secretion protein